jgi:hypothetical protein
VSVASFGLNGFTYRSAPPYEDPTWYNRRGRHEVPSGDFRLENFLRSTLHHHDESATRWDARVTRLWESAQNEASWTDRPMVVDAHLRAGRLLLLDSKAFVPAGPAVETPRREALSQLIR